MPPDRHHADAGTTPAQPEGKVTGMTAMLGGYRGRRGRGTGGDGGGELRLGSVGRTAAAGEWGPLAGLPPIKGTTGYPPD